MVSPTLVASSGSRGTMGHRCLLSSDRSQPCFLLICSANREQGAFGSAVNWGLSIDRRRPVISDFYPISLAAGSDL